MQNKNRKRRASAQTVVCINIRCLECLQAESLCQSGAHRWSKGTCKNVAAERWRGWVTFLLLISNTNKNNNTFSPLFAPASSQRRVSCLWWEPTFFLMEMEREHAKQRESLQLRVLQSELMRGKNSLFWVSSSITRRYSEMIYVDSLSSTSPLTPFHSHRARVLKITCCRLPAITNVIFSQKLGHENDDTAVWLRGAVYFCCLRLMRLISHC